MQVDVFARAAPFRLEIDGLGPVLSAVLERVLALDRLNAAYARVSPASVNADFVDVALRTLRVRCGIADDELARVPATGSLIAVANHPFGAIEGLVLIQLLRRVRPDVRVLGNRLLARIPELRPVLFDVDVFGGPAAAASNRGALRQAVRWLRGGGALAVFPAGEVSHVRLGEGVVDPPWNDDVAALARRAGAAVVPVRFRGANGPVFQAAGLVHPRLRTALLPRELLNKAGRTIDVRVGAVVPAGRLARFEDDSAATAYLRARTDILAMLSATAHEPAPSAGETLASAEDPATLAAEVDALAAGRVLAKSGDLAVLLVEGDESPALLRAVGLAREISFRAAGEGTGRPTDLDRFDRHYSQLVLWDRASRTVAGGYRLAATDEVLRTHGPDGLYTTTLFEPVPGFFERLGPALELGRSFVIPARQRSFSPLMLLWKGIGAWVAAHPRYRTVFGPVSISRRYSPYARRLIVEWLRRHAWAPELAPLVRPRNPLRTRSSDERSARTVSAALPAIEDLSDAVADLVPQLRGVPILVREYHRLSGRFAAFNIDPDFSDVIDGLVVIDLVRADRRSIARYLGRDGVRALLEHHRLTAADSRA